MSTRPATKISARVPGHLLAGMEEISTRTGLNFSSVLILLLGEALDARAQQTVTTA